MADGPVGGARKPDLATIVTGASEGLGLALAREFARGGHNLLLVARSRRPLQAACDAISAEFGVRTLMAVADLGTREGCAGVEEAVRAQGLVANVLVNNAGLGDCDPVAEADPQQLNAIADLNVRAPVDLTRRFLPGMIERRSGGILNVSSLAGFLPGPYQAVYYASKAFLLSFTEALAQELRGTNVKAAVLAPGPVNTEFHARMGGEGSLYTRFQGLMSPEYVARIGYVNFRCGQQVIIPGAFNLLTAVAVKFLPHAVLTPFTGWLLKRRNEKANA